MKIRACLLVLAAILTASVVLFRPVEYQSGGPVHIPVWPDDLEVSVEITPDIPDLYSRCVAVLTVAEIPAHICEGLIK